MTPLDMRTIVFSYVLTNFICAWFIVLLWRQSRNRFAGMAFLVFDFIFQATALVLIVMRGAIPDWMSMILANVLVIAGAILGFMGLERFTGKKGPQGHNAVLLILFILLHSYFVVVHPSLATRNLNIAVALLLVCFQSAWLMLRRVDPAMRSLTFNIGVVNLLYCLVSVVRILHFIIAPDEGNNYFQPAIYEALVLLSYQMLFILLTYSLVLMVNRRLLVDIGIQEEKFSKAFHSAPYAITITRLSDGAVMDVNERFADITGFDRSEVVGKQIADLHLWEDMKDRDTVIAMLLASSRVDGMELRFRHKNGQPIMGLFSAEIIAIDGAQSILSSIADITERKNAAEEKAKLEAENRQLQKSESLGRMAGAIAHIFNNQLGVVIGNLEMAIDDLPYDASPVGRLTAAMQAAGKAADMSGNMLAYLGQISGKREPLDLSETCRRNLPRLRANIPENILLETALPAPGPTISADMNQIHKVLVSLITNAWEAISSDGGAIHLSVTTVTAAEIPRELRRPIDWQPQDIGYACIAVADTGHGIDDTDIENLFDPFFSSKFTGRGLGLAVTLGIVRAYGGVITLTTKREQGSTFQVFLPLSADELRPLPDQAHLIPEADGKGAILLIEDEEMVRSMATAMLTRLGHAVISAADGVEALELFRQHRDEIRLVISDLTMPRMNGWETLTALRELVPDLPVILASGYDRAQVMAGDHAELPQVFLGKPYKLKELGEAIGLALLGIK